MGKNLLHVEPSRAFKGLSIGCTTPSARTRGHCYSGEKAARDSSDFDLNTGHPSALYTSFFVGLLVEVLAVWFFLLFIFLFTAMYNTRLCNPNVRSTIQKETARRLFFRTQSERPGSLKGHPVCKPGAEDHPSHIMAVS
jgi:hypothetical protein